MKPKNHVLGQLFLSALYISAFPFGGGYAAMPLIQGQVITAHGWLTMAEFGDLVTIAEMTPGPIAVMVLAGCANMILRTLS